MEAVHPNDDVARLQRCISSLDSVLGLPALWSDGQPSQIVRSLLDVLPGLLGLDIIYVRLSGEDDAEPLEMTRVSGSAQSETQTTLISQEFRSWLNTEPQSRPRQIRNALAEGRLALTTLPLGLHGELGEMVAGAQRMDFPRQFESVLLSVAAK